MMTTDTQSIMTQEPVRQCVICGCRFQVLFPDDHEAALRCQLCSDSGLSAYETKTLLAWTSFHNAAYATLVRSQVARITQLSKATICATIQSLTRQGYTRKTAIYGYYHEFECWGYDLTDQGRDFLIREGALS